MKVGKTQNYLTQMYTIYPEWFHPDTVMYVVRDHIISQEGINFYIDNANLQKSKNMCRKAEL